MIIAVDMILLRPSTGSAVTIMENYQMEDHLSDAEAIAYVKLGVTVEFPGWDLSRIHVTRDGKFIESRVY